MYKQRVVEASVVFTVRGCSAGSVHPAGAVTAAGRVSVPEGSSELGSALLGKLCRVCGEAKAGLASISPCQGHQPCSVPRPGSGNQIE